MKKENQFLSEKINLMTDMTMLETEEIIRRAKAPCLTRLRAKDKMIKDMNKNQEKLMD